MTSDAPRAPAMASAWWWVWGVALALLAVFYAYHLIPEPNRSWDEMGRGIARLLIAAVSAGGFTLLAAAALPGALAGREGQAMFAAASLGVAALWALIAVGEA